MICFELMISNFLHFAIIGPDIDESSPALNEFVSAIKKDKNIIICRFPYVDKKNTKTHEVFNQLLVSLSEKKLVFNASLRGHDSYENLTDSIGNDVPILYISIHDKHPHKNNVNILRLHKSDENFNCFLRRIPIKIQQNRFLSEILNMIKSLERVGIVEPFHLEICDPYINKDFVEQIISKKLFSKVSIKINFCRPRNLCREEIKTRFVSDSPSLIKTGKLYDKCNAYLRAEAKKSINDFQQICQRKYPKQLSFLRATPDRLLFAYYHPKAGAYSMQKPQSFDCVVSDIQTLWHHRSFKISGGEGGIFSNAYESAHSFISPIGDIHQDSEPLHFRLVSNTEFGSVLNKGVWEQPYVMNIDGNIR